MESSSSSYMLSGKKASELEALLKQHEERALRIQELKRQIEEVKLRLETKKKEVPEETVEDLRKLNEKYNSLRNEYNALLAQKSQQPKD